MAGRVTQTPVEALVQPTTQKARYTQAGIEVLVQPSTQRARLTQMAIEVLRPNTGLADDFATPAAAPLASPRQAEPGPGQWTVIDTGASLSVVAPGRLRFNGGLSWSDPRLEAALADADVAAFAALARRRGDTTTGPAVLLGAASAPDPTAAGHGLWIDNYELQIAGAADLRGGPAVRLRSIDYWLAVVRRPGGGVWLLVGGGAIAPPGEAALVWTERADSYGATLYAVLASSGGQSDVDAARTTTAALLPAAFATRFGPALAGEDGSGTTGSIDGLAPSASGGTWDVWQGGLARSGGVLQGTTAGLNRANLTGLSAAPTFISLTVNMAAAGREVYIDFRNNGVNRLSLAIDATQLYLFSSYSAATLASTGISSPSGVFRLAVYDDGATVRVYKDDAYLFAVATSDGAGAAGAGFTVQGADSPVLEWAAYPATVTLPSVLGAGPQPPQATGAPTATDAFAGVDGTALATHDPAWTIQSGAWEISGGTARLTADNALGVATREAGQTDHAVEAVVTTPATLEVAGGWYCGLVARYADADNLIYVRMLYQSNSPEFELWQEVGGVATLLNFVNFGAGGLAPSTAYTMRLAVEGAEVAVYRDGELVLQGTTTLLTGTQAGIGVVGNAADGRPTWDDFKLWGAAATGVTVTPVAAGMGLATSAPTVVKGAISATPTASGLGLTTAAPTVVQGGVSVTPAAASLGLTTVAPAVVRGPLSVAPAASGLGLATIDPTVSIVVSVTPVAGGLGLTTANPTVILGAVTLTPAPARAGLTTIAPTVTLGATTATPAPAGLGLATTAPTVVRGGLTLMPAAAALGVATVNPGVIRGPLRLTPAGAALGLASVAPTVTLGALTLQPAAVALGLGVAGPRFPGAPGTVGGAVALAASVGGAVSPAHSGGGAVRQTHTVGGTVRQ